MNQNELNLQQSKNDRVTFGDDWKYYFPSVNFPDLRKLTTIQVVSIAIFIDEAINHDICEDLPTFGAQGILGVFRSKPIDDPDCAFYCLTDKFNFVDFKKNTKNCTYQDLIKGFEEQSTTNTN